MPDSSKTTPVDLGLAAIERTAAKENADGLGPRFSDRGFDETLAAAKAEEGIGDLCRAVDKRVNGKVTVVH